MKSRVNTAITISLHAAPEEPVALMASIGLADAAEPPEWVHLLPAGPAIETRDGRGPYRVVDPAKVIERSREVAGEQGAPIDENHATDLAAPHGQPAPARGWNSGGWRSRHRCARPATPAFASGSSAGATITSCASPLRPPTTTRCCARWNSPAWRGL